jgi:hypothetical protein
MLARESIRAITNRVRGLARAQNLDDVYVDEEGTVAIRRGPARVKLENSDGVVMIHRKGIVAEPVGSELHEPDIEKAAQLIMNYLCHN